MDNRKNQMLIGIIICIIGVFAIFVNIAPFSLFDVLITAAGGACLLLYVTKKMSFSLIIGAYLTYFGAVRILDGMFGGALSVNGFVAMFFIVPSAVFFVLYFDKNKRGLLFPASILLYMGVYLMLKDFLFFPYMSGGFFLICMAFSFLTVYFIGKGAHGRWSLQLGLVLLVLGGLSSMNMFSAFAAFGSLRYVGAGILIVLGLLVILGAFVKRKNNK